jgi:hypothetical protein
MRPCLGWRTVSRRQRSLAELGFELSGARGEARRRDEVGHVCTGAVRGCQAFEAASRTTKACHRLGVGLKQAASDCVKDELHTQMTSGGQVDSPSLL